MRKTIISLILLVILACISAFLNWPFIFILSFAAFCYTTLGICTFAAWQFFCKLIKIDKGKRLAAFIFASVCLLLFIFGRMAINRHYMPGSQGLSILRVSFKVMLLIATGTLFWGFVKSPKKTIPVICGGFYILFIVLAPFVSMLKNTEENASDTSERSLADTLRTLPYVTWAPVESTEEVGVTIHDPNLAFQGLSIYETRDPDTYLIDMEGNLLHTWHLPSEDLMSIYAEMSGNGDLLVFAIDKMFAKLDWDSNVLWKTKLRAHHDFHVADSDDIYVLARKDSMVFIKGLPVPILEDYIAVLSPEGALLRTINIFDSVKDHHSLKSTMLMYQRMAKPKAVIRMITKKITAGYAFVNDKELDIMHVNAIELLDRNIPGVGAAGNILLSIREIDLIGVLDSDKNQLVWKWGPGRISKQHRPTVLDNNNILLFDNGCGSGFSRILEIEPLSKRIVWSYNSDGSADFFTAKGGNCQRLPNGNTLISQTQTGRAFEVNRDGKIVWQYLNPNIDEEENTRKTIFFMERLKNPEKYPVLKKL